MTDPRLEDMLVRYGEVCNMKTAAGILSCSIDKVRRMLNDGRLRRACMGSMVDVRSVYEYIVAPAKAEERKRINTMKQKYGTNWAV